MLRLLVSMCFETEVLRHSVDQKIESVEQNQKNKQEYLIALSSQK